MISPHYSEFLFYKLEPQFMIKHRNNTYNQLNSGLNSLNLYFMKVTFLNRVTETNALSNDILGSVFTNYWLGFVWTLKQKNVNILYLLNEKWNLEPAIKMSRM